MEVLFMKGIDKIKMLKDILDNKDLVSTKILKEKPVSEGVLKVSAVGKTPEEAKQVIMDKLKGMDLNKEEDMESKLSPEELKMMEDSEGDMGADDSEEEMSEPEMETCPECGANFSDNCEECGGEMDEESLNPEDQGILELLPEKTKLQFKKRLMEKMKSM